MAEENPFLDIARKARDKVVKKAEADAEVSADSAPTTAVIPQPPIPESTPTPATTAPTAEAPNTDEVKKLEYAQKLEEIIGIGKAYGYGEPFIVNVDGENFITYSTASSGLLPGSVPPPADANMKLGEYIDEALTATSSKTGLTADDLIYSYNENRGVFGFAVSEIESRNADDKYFEKLAKATTELQEAAKKGKEYSSSPVQEITNQRNSYAEKLSGVFGVNVSVAPFKNIGDTDDYLVLEIPEGTDLDKLGDAVAEIRNNAGLTKEQLGVTVGPTAAISPSVISFKVSDVKKYPGGIDALVEKLGDQKEKMATAITATALAGTTPTAEAPVVAPQIAQIDASKDFAINITRNHDYNTITKGSVIINGKPVEVVGKKLGESFTHDGVTVTLPSQAQVETQVTGFNNGVYIAPVAVAAAASDAAKDSTYTIQDGDTLGKIADKQGVERKALLEANRLSEGQPIYIGETLIIPGKNKSEPAAALAAPTPPKPGAVVTDVTAKANEAAASDAPAPALSKDDLNKVLTSAMIKVNATGGFTSPDPAENKAELKAAAKAIIDAEFKGRDQEFFKEIDSMTQQDLGSLVGNVQAATLAGELPEASATGTATAAAPSTPADAAPPTPSSNSSQPALSGGGSEAPSAYARPAANGNSGSGQQRPANFGQQLMEYDLNYLGIRNGQELAAKIPGAIGKNSEGNLVTNNKLVADVAVSKALGKVDGIGLFNKDDGVITSRELEMAVKRGSKAVEVLAAHGMTPQDVLGKEHGSENSRSNGNSRSQQNDDDRDESKDEGKHDNSRKGGIHAIGRAIFGEKKNFKDADHEDSRKAPCAKCDDHKPKRHGKD